MEWKVPIYTPFTPKLIFSRVLLNTATYVCRCSTMKLQVAITWILRKIQFFSSVSVLTSHVFPVWIDLSTLSRFENVFSLIIQNYKIVSFEPKTWFSSLMTHLLAQCYWIIQPYEHKRQAYMLSRSFVKNVLITAFPCQSLHWYLLPSK